MRPTNLTIDNLPILVLLYFELKHRILSDFNGAAFVLSFSSAASRQGASVGIIEDSTVESLTPEVFRLAAMTDAPRVEVRPAMVDVFIQDDEGKHTKCLHVWKRSL